jgi:hypothetical protein
MKIYRGERFYILEEIDWLDDCLWCKYSFSFCFTEGEPMVKYYPDGSGYPGSDPEFEIYDVQVVSVEGENGFVQVDEELKEYLLGMFEENKERVIEEVSESLAE